MDKDYPPKKGNIQQSAQCYLPLPDDLHYSCDSLKVKYQAGSMCFQKQESDRFLSSRRITQVEVVQLPVYSECQLLKKGLKKKDVKKVRTSRPIHVNTYTHTKHTHNTHTMHTHETRTQVENGQALGVWIHRSSEIQRDTLVMPTTL